MAVSVLACERVLAHMDGRPAGWLDEPSRDPTVSIKRMLR
jgi:hypothetical protein